MKTHTGSLKEHSRRSKAQGGDKGRQVWLENQGKTGQRGCLMFPFPGNIELE